MWICSNMFAKIGVTKDYSIRYPNKYINILIWLNHQIVHKSCYDWRLVICDIFGAADVRNCENTIDARFGWVDDYEACGRKSLCRNFSWSVCDECKNNNNNRITHSGFISFSLHRIRMLSIQLTLQIFGQLVIVSLEGVHHRCLAVSIVQAEISAGGNQHVANAAMLGSGCLVQGRLPATTWDRVQCDERISKCADATHKNTITVHCPPCWRWSLARRRSGTWRYHGGHACCRSAVPSGRWRRWTAMRILACATLSTGSGWFHIIVVK